MTTMTSPLTTNFTPAASLLSRVILVAPSLRRWQGQYRLRNAEIRLNGEKLDTKKTTGTRTKLLETSGDRVKAWKERFVAFESDRKTIVEKYSTTFPINGVRIVPRDKAEEFFDAMVGPVDRQGQPVFQVGRDVQSLAYRVAQTADRFVEDYDNVIDDIRAHQDPAVWSYISKIIPEKHRMRERFGLDIAPVELQGSGGTSTVRTTREDLQRYDQLVQASTLRLVDQAVEEMIAGPRDQLAKELGDLHELISRDGRITDRSFNGVREAIAKIRSFSFVATDDLLRQIEDISTRIGAVQVPANLDSATATSNGLLTALDTLRDDVEDEVRRAEDVERFGRSLRGFHL